MKVKFRWNKRKSVSLLLAMMLMMLFAVGQVFAATVYVGNVGFDTDKLDNQPQYLASFLNYLANHCNDAIIVDAGGGFIFDANAFSNAPEGTSLAQFVASNPIKNPPTGNVWDGNGNPGEVMEDFCVVDIY